jgi:hypothetical protein
MSAQAPLVSLIEASLVSLVETRSEQPTLPAITSAIMTALKPIDIKSAPPKFLYELA